MTRVAVVGAAGRMGKTLIQAVHAADRLQLAAATEQPDSTLVGADAGELAGVGALGVMVSHSLTKVVDAFDVVIDFTSPAATAVHLDVCRQHGKAIVIGTTGASIGVPPRVGVSTSPAAIGAGIGMPDRANCGKCHYGAGGGAYANYSNGGNGGGRLPGQRLGALPGRCARRVDGRGRP